MKYALFKVLICFFLARNLAATPFQQTPGDTTEAVIEPLPIISYDTDTGIGYGAKLFMLRLLNARESFDLTFFNSTKGERWYRFVFSVPDFELRQGRIYDLALDLVADYERWRSYSFYGTGPHSQKQDREKYTFEVFDLRLDLSRSFSRELVCGVGLRSRTGTNSNFESGSRLQNIPPPENRGSVQVFSFLITLRYDGRDSYINPHNGYLFSTSLEKSLSTPAFSSWNASINYYSPVLKDAAVIAMRLYYAAVFGEDLPVQLLLPLGGNTSLRGSVQGRYVGNTLMIMNHELRFRLFGRLGGIIGWDLGWIANSPGAMGLADVKMNPVAGLRYYFDTFVVRLDAGFGAETTGVYFNFGHIF